LASAHESAPAIPSGLRGAPIRRRDRHSASPSERNLPQARLERLVFASGGSNGRFGEIQAVVASIAARKRGDGSVADAP
jgi:hypothetical protein